MDEWIPRVPMLSPQRGTSTGNTAKPITATAYIVGVFASDPRAVNAICPGIIDTPLLQKIAGTRPDLTGAADMLTPMARRGRPDEIGQVALFLASDASSFVTGAAYPADGGLAAL